MGTDHDDFDLDKAVDALWETCAAPHPRDMLRREHDELLKGRPRDIALEKHGLEIEAEMMREWAHYADALKHGRAEILEFPSKEFSEGS